jgi:Flp pilus assembly protein TadB
VEVLEKVAARLEALGDHFGPSDAKRTIERVREKQTSRGEKPKATPISRLPLVILLVTGVVVVLGAPLAMALGFGLIGVALAFLFDRRRYPEPAHPRS